MPCLYYAYIMPIAGMLFYADAYDYGKTEGREALYKSIIKGKIPAGEIKFRFRGVDELEPEKAFDKIGKVTYGQHRAFVKK